MVNNNSFNYQLSDEVYNLNGNILRVQLNSFGLCDGYESIHFIVKLWQNMSLFRVEIPIFIHTYVHVNPHIEIPSGQAIDQPSIYPSIQQ